jgi:hypothetical protein
MIIFRETRLQEHTFIEYLLIFAAETLVNPCTIPDRYADRIEFISTIGGLPCCKVLSATSDLQIVNRKGLLAGNGIWVVSDDCTPRGGFEEVPDIRLFLTFQIDDVSARDILLVDKELSARLSKPLSLYHGTDRDNVSSIVEHGISPSDGMMSRAIYLGTLWKAVRFAILGQNYKKRNGSIFRVLSFPKSTAHFPRKGWMCECKKCLDNQWARSIVDHHGLWQIEHDCAHVHATRAPETFADGRPKYLLKNDEWALSPKTACIATHCAQVEDSYGEHYDPKLRNVVIS